METRRGGTTDCDYVPIVDMGMFIRKAIPNQDQRFKDDGQVYVWNDYVEHCVSYSKNIKELLLSSVLTNHMAKKIQ